MSQNQKSPIVSDDAVTEVVRRMTSGAPSDALRANVRKRLDAPLTLPLWRRPSVLAMAACGLLATSAVSIHSIARMSRVTAHPTLIAEHTSPAPVAESTAPALLPSATKTSVSAESTADSSPAELSAEEQAWLARAVPALPSPDALTIDAIEPVPMAIPQLKVDPLVTPAIDLSSTRNAGGGGR